MRPSTMKQAPINSDRRATGGLNLAPERLAGHRPALAEPSGNVTCELPELMTVNDFLQLYRIGRTSFYREVRSRRLKIVKFGTATRITRSDAEAWMASLPVADRSNS